MSFINWDSHFSVGLPAMDQQHKKMADIINQFHAGLRANIDGEKLALLVQALIQVTEAHCEEEEKIMEKMGFPNLDHHKEGHRQICDQLLELQKKLADGNRPALTEASVFFRNWFMTHVQKDDRDYGVFLYNQRTKVRADAAVLEKAKKEEPVK